MDQQPKIPTLKDAQKPQVKIKGMGAGLTLFDRLKQFKKKDLAFILAGLGTLFMAPLAEHFMMAPESGDASLQKGWGGGSGAGSNLFGSGSSPYENGNNSIAQGGAIGGSGDIITPLNVRDPSALVMGPGAAQQPPAGSGAPAVAPPTAPAKSETDYKDALAGAASRAASAAVKRAPLPVPKIALGGSGGLRGLGAASGGSSSGSGSLGPINSGNLGQAGTGGGGLNLVRSNPNFRGAAGPRGNSPTGLDGTKRAGANAGDAFSRTGSALGGLNQAAAEQIPTGGQGFGGGGQGGAGANDKPGGGAGAAGSKSVGESLAFIEAKERMMENLKLEFEKRKLKDPELLLYGIRNDSLKAMAAEATKMLTKSALGLFADAAGAKSFLRCPPGTGSKIPMSTAENNSCDTSKAGYFNCYSSSNGAWIWQKDPSPAAAIQCEKITDAGTTGPSKTDVAAANAAQGRVTVPAGAAAGSISSLCSKLDGDAAAVKKDKDAAQRAYDKSPSQPSASLELFKAQESQVANARRVIGNVNQAQNALSGSGKADPNACRDAVGLDASIKFTDPAMSVNDHVQNMRTQIGGPDGKAGLVGKLKSAINPPAADKMKGIKGDVEKVVKEWTDTSTLLQQATALLNKEGTITMDKFPESSVRRDKADVEKAVKDSLQLAASLDKVLKSLKPAIDGLEASGAKVGEAANGSTQSLVDAAGKYDAAVDKAKKLKIKDDKGVEGPLLTDAEVKDAKEALPKPEEGGAKPAGTTPALVADAEKVVASAKKVTEAVKTTDAGLVETATDNDKKSAKKTLLGAVLKDIGEGIKIQGEVLDGVGNLSDQSTKAVETPKVEPVVAGTQK